MLMKGDKMADLFLEVNTTAACTINASRFLKCFGCRGITFKEAKFRPCSLSIKISPTLFISLFTEFKLEMCPFNFFNT